MRRLLDRRGLTIAAAARGADMPRERLSRALNGRAHLRSEQWQRLYVSLGVHAAIIAAIVEVLDGA